MSKPSAGQSLKDSRLKRHLAIDECSKRTHISPRYIEALENDRWDELPSESHRLGFIRLYARFLGLSADEMVSLYQHRNDPPPVESEPTPIIVPIPQRQIPNITPVTSSSQTTITTDPKIERLLALPWSRIGLGLAVVLTLAWFVYHAKVKVSDNVPTKWEDFHPRQARLSSSSSSLMATRLKIYATEDVWCHLTQGGIVLYSGVLHTGQTKNWQPNSPVQLRIGNIDSLQVFWNDQPVDLLTGARGKVNVVTLPSTSVMSSPPASSQPVRP